MDEAYEERLEALREQRRQEEAVIRRDAARYRWLRDRMIPDELTAHPFPPVPPIIRRPLDLTVDSNDEFDRLIDAGMQGANA